MHTMATTYNTQEEFEQVMSQCRNLFADKLHDYGAAWRVLRTETLTDQLFIKAARIRSIQTKGCSMVDEGIVPEFIGLVNYSLVGLIQLDLGVAEVEDLPQEKALDLYDAKARETQELKLRKNHDYNEAWRAMRVSSYVDLIYMKIFRTKQIEDLDGTTRVSEGIAANYMDIMNYAVFGLIKLTLEQE